MSTTVSLDVLKNVQVASPCTANWDQMVGDDRARTCAECKLKVFNISAMTEDEAAAFLTESTGRVCIRLYRRADGTIITQDCPVGVRLVRQKLAKSLGRIAAAAALLIGGGISVATGAKEYRLPKLATIQPFSTLRAWLTPGRNVPAQTVQTLKYQIELGRMRTDTSLQQLPPRPGQ